MVSMDCARCPAVAGDCEGCIVSLLLGEKDQVDELSPESCGYVLDPEVRTAIDVLRAVGMVTSIDILAAETAA
ncbi:hypothetical protein C3V38_12035 [Dietzia sp. oral taxon 368]|nr:hypothetical protein [Dietzia sp. oral taxon 368]AVM64984.1 hypothetical protein C3V38_12035 [Dietzia sp. oral taxon 368]